MGRSGLCKLPLLYVAKETKDRVITATKAQSLSPSVGRSLFAHFKYILQLLVEEKVHHQRINCTVTYFFLGLYSLSQGGTTLTGTLC